MTDRAESICACGDREREHVLGRGACLICRDGTPPPDGADGCQRFRAAPDAECPAEFGSLDGDGDYAHCLLPVGHEPPHESNLEMW